MIAWYVHHHGSGHAHRALSIARELTVPVVGLSTRPAPEGWPGRWVRLPDDAGGDGVDVTAGGTLHWAPLAHPGLRERMAVVSSVLAGGGVRLLVADVSVEVTVLARLHGIPVAVVVGPGVRTDAPHALAFDQASLLLAPWPEDPARPPDPRWAAKTRHVGALSRYDHLVAPPPSGRDVLVLGGSGGTSLTGDDLAAAATATPGWRWSVAGATAPGGGSPANLRFPGWVDDTWAALCEAHVVVTHAGQNALAEVAAARRPAVVVPEERPFGEQRATADALARGDLAVVEAGWPEPGRWPGLLEGAVARGGAGWSAWSPGDGAARAARAIEALL